MSEENKGISPNNKNEWNRVWEYHKTADILFVDRFNFFLVAESMFIISFATLSASQNSENLFDIKIPILLLGIIFTLSWYWVNVRLLCKIWYLKNKYLEDKKFDPFYLDYMRTKDNAENKTQRHLVQAYLLPLSTMFFWIFLLFYIILIDFYEYSNSPANLIIIAISTAIFIFIIVLILKLFHNKIEKIEEIVKKIDNLAARILKANDQQN